MKALLFLGTFLFALFQLANLHAQNESSLVYPGENGKLIYVDHPNSNESNSENKIIDFSHCGYMEGGVKITDVAVKTVIYPQPGDDKKRIQEAINYVSGLEPDKNGFRGAVLLKAGTYELYTDMTAHGDAIQIRASGVILRGEGQGPYGTILKTNFESKHQIIATRPENPSKTLTNKTRITDTYLGSGAFGFHVEDASTYEAGDTILLRFTPNQTWLDEIYVNTYMASDDTDWDINTYTINYERRVLSVDGDSITIHSPVILPMQTKFGGGEIEKMSLNGKERLNRVGVEYLRLVGPGITSTCPADDPNRLKTGIMFNHTENSWIRGVTVVHTSNSHFVSWDSHYNTFEDLACIMPLGPKKAGYRYSFYIDAASSHNLVQRTFTDDGRHDYVLGPRVPGPNVFLDGVSQRGGTQGPHQRWATGTLFDNLKLESLIALEHRGSSGSGHGWAGIQSTIWNTESPNIICDAPTGHMNYAIGNISVEMLSQYVNNTKTGVYRGYYDHHGSHVSTRSLYLKQLEDRLGSNAVENITIEEQRNSDIYDMLENWKGKGDLINYASPFLEAPSDLNLYDWQNSESEKFIVLNWTDNSSTETKFVLERSADGGINFQTIQELDLNTTTYKDTDILQSTYHYRLKAQSNELESSYTNLYIDLNDENLSSAIGFNVDLSETSNLYSNGKVWLKLENDDKLYEMTDSNNDGIYNTQKTFRTGIEIGYNYAYQNGADQINNVQEEELSSECANDAGYRTFTVPEADVELDAYLFGSCDVALPPGEDITDLEGLIIIGSNEDEPWIDGDNGAGSPPNETIDKLIDNSTETKYLVRAVSSWLEIKIPNFARLNGYAISSANDDPTRDPKNWILKGKNIENDRWEVIHQVNNQSAWERRFMTKVWTFESDSWYHRFRLYITDINGNSQGLMQMSELQIFGEIGDPSSIIHKQNQPILVYPNPAKKFLTIEHNNTTSGNFQLVLQDISGKTVYSKDITATSEKVHLNLTDFPSGVYILSLRSETNIWQEKIIIN